MFSLSVAPRSVVGSATHRTGLHMMRRKVKRARASVRAVTSDVVCEEISLPCYALNPIRIQLHFNFQSDHKTSSHYAPGSRMPSPESAGPSHEVDLYS